MAIELRDFPVPTIWDDLEGGALVLAEIQDALVIGIVAAGNGRKLLLVLKVLSGANSHGTRELQLIAPPNRAERIGQGLKIVARPLEPDGLPRRGALKDGALIVSQGSPCVRLSQSGETYMVSLVDGTLSNPPTPQAYYEKWVIAVVDGERERKVIEVNATP